MQDFLDYVVSNIPLFCVCFIVIFLAFRNFKVRRKESIYFLVFTTLVIYLSFAVALERDFARVGNAAAATIFTTSGYIVRPVLLYVFCLLANMERKRRKLFYYAWAAPLLVNFIIYLFPLFFGVPGISTVVFSYQPGPNGTVVFTRGGPLNFFSHIVSIAYLILLIYVSILRFNGKHRRDGMVIALCVIFILATVTAEVLTGRNDLLNIVCEICALINYIFITSINTSRDVLTNLYDRRTFYEDSQRYNGKINGIIQIDMNGLKRLNDEFGHNVGDTALNEVAKIFDESLHKDTMFAYRLSGDEFVILMIQGKKEYLERTVNQIKSLMDATHYSVAIGSYFIDKDDDIDFKVAMKKAEELMYKDKERFYSENNLERRDV